MKELAIGEVGEINGKLVKCVESSGCLQCCFHDEDCTDIECTDRRDGRIVMFILPDACTWTQDADGIWHTSCGQAQEFTTGTREENGYKFCPYCGNEIQEANHDKE